MINKGNLEPLLSYAEKVIREKSLSEDIFLLEYEKFFNCILQGKDIINTYERRHFGISDEEWNEAKELFFKEINIEVNLDAE